MNNIMSMRQTIKTQAFNKQKGMTFIGLVLVIAAIICFAVLGMKITPAYLEFMNVKKAVKKAASEGGSKKEMSDAFDRSANIDNITVVKGSDLVVNGENVSVQYQVVVPIVANASVLLDFDAASK
jgi:Domain of unknown function (DUF4845)